MQIFKHEITRARKAWLIWTLSLVLTMGIIIAFYPEMADQMKEMGLLFRGLGIFATALGMDKLDISSFIGFYGIEAGVILGLGGGIYGALNGVGILAGEEGQRSAEFVFSLPIKRSRVLAEKILSLVLLILSMSALVMVTSYLMATGLNIEFPGSTFMLFHLVITLLALEIGLLSFAIAAFMSRENFGLCIGLVLGMYVASLLINISEKVAFLKYFTPFYYADAARVISANEAEWSIIGLQYALVAVVLFVAFRYYEKKALRV